MTTTPEWLLPWAKLGRSRDREYPRDAHPVACHLLDVAYVAEILWQDCLAPSVRQRWAAAFGISEADCGRWTAFWAGSHDIGKTCPAFQAQDPSGRAPGILQGAGLHVGHPGRVRHDHVSAYLLPELWTSGESCSPMDRRLAKCVAAVIGGHHGIIPEPGRCTNCSTSELGSGPWNTVRRQILTRLADALDMAGRPAPQMPASIAGGFFYVLAGLIAVADWIGSSREYFPPAGTVCDWPGYCRRSRNQAQQAVASLGWTGWRAETTAPLDFTTLFGFDSTRPLQDTVQQLVDARTGPALILIEAPMGEGKTEAALYAADRHTHARGGRGMYVALPTTATSNGMFGRIRNFLDERYSPDPGSPPDRVNLQLLHGRTFLSETFAELKLAAIADDLPESASQVVAEEWFARDRKQGLLAPFAVGTIDQALLSVLQTKFAFVRMFGLAGKTVILDEVHAYDAYTSTILGRMLTWLNAIGSPVVILSATLPRATRHRLLAEYLHGNPDAALDISDEQDQQPYPRVTVAASDSGTIDVQAFHADPRRRLEVRLQAIHAPQIGTLLIEALAEGGTTAVICNTVSRAQELFRELRQTFSGTSIAVDLFHARFPLGDRQKIEDQVLERFGRNHTDEIRPPGVLVATQVVEQSLDLDFDLMVTEFAPADLVLQRAGRLHRHMRQRPGRFLGRPELWLIEPDTDTHGIPQFGRFEDTVYSRFVLLRSYLAIAGRQTLGLPDDIESLVELVYSEAGPEPPDASWKAALESSQSGFEQAIAVSRQNARGVLVSPPDSGGLLLNRSRDLTEEDDPKSWQSLLARTREGGPSVEVVLVYRSEEGVSLTPDGTAPLNLQSEPRGSELRQIVERSVSLSHPRWVHHFAAQDPPSGWQRSGALRFHRIAELDQQGVCRTPFGELRFDEAAGVELLNS